MHLSVLADCLDAPRPPAVLPSSTPNAHRDSVIRGLALLGIAGAFLGLAFVSGLSPSAAADTPQRRAASLSDGAAVNLMHREVTRH